MEPKARDARPVGLLNRTLRRWRALLALGLVLTAPLIAGGLALGLGARTYESTAWLKVDPGVRSLLAGSRSGPADLGASLETQVQLITSPDVLGTALQDPRVAALPRVRSSLDPETELRNHLRVVIVPRTQLIQVSMASESPTEPPVIIGAVVDAYLRASSGWIDEETRIQLAQLKEMKKKFAADRENQRQALIGKARDVADARRREDDRKSDRTEEYQALKAELNAAEIAQIKAEAELEVQAERAKDPGQVEPIKERLAVLEATSRRLLKRLEYLDTAAHRDDAQALELRFAEADLKYTDEMLAAIGKNLDQLEYEARGGNKINLIARAKPNFEPKRDRRPLLGLAPLVGFAAAFGLLMLAEAVAGRAAAGH